MSDLLKSSADTLPGHESLSLRALRIAEGELARGAGEVSDNVGPDIEKYLSFDDPRERRKEGAWCAGFVSWCFTEAERVMGTSGIFPGSISAERLRQRCITRGWYIANTPDARLPVPGDLFFRRGVDKPTADHVGFVWQPDIVRRKFASIEGNALKPPCKVTSKVHHIDVPADRIIGWVHLVG